MPKRKKPDIKITPVNSLQEAEAALERIAGYEWNIHAQESILNADIERAKKASLKIVEPLLNRIKSLELGLAAFAEKEKTVLFKTKKSYESAFGIFGFRKSTPLKTLKGWTWGKVLEKLMKKKGMPAVRVKYEVDKDQLHAWKDEALADVGVVKKPKDEFFYEIKKETVKKS